MAREVKRGTEEPEELSAWPVDIRALAAPLYAAGLPLHCLPLYWQWHYARLDATTDLREDVPRRTFLAPSALALASGGVPGRSTAWAAIASAGGGPWNYSTSTPPATRSRRFSVTRARHPPGRTSPMRPVSPPWQVTMPAATAGRAATGGVDGRGAFQPAAPTGARPPPAAPLHAPARVVGFAAWLT
jgi:hypothetical protein